MKAFKLALLGAVFSVGAIAAAQAADVYSKGGSFKDEPDDLPAITWTGFYVGAHAGATFDDGINVDSGISNLRANLESDTSFEGGFQIGYNKQFWGNWVGGVEVDYTFMDSDINVGGLKADTTDYLASVRGRLGRTYDRTFYYGTAGVAFLGWDDDIKGAFDDDTAVGFVVGGGIDYKVNNAVSIGFETLYYRFDDTKLGEAVSDGREDVERDFTVAQVRLNYHLNGLPDPLK